jgi:hypothetical protein
MPTNADISEIAEPSYLQVENWRSDERKEEPYLERKKSLIWNYDVIVPPSLSAEMIISRLIADSESLLQFRDDSDEGFVPYSKETLDRAIGFLKRYVSSAVKICETSVPIPRLLPGPSGSIDIHWKNDSRELVVNIPADNKARALFYGDDFGSLCIKGSLDKPLAFYMIQMWLLDS